MIDATPTTTEPKSRRRWYQYSLRTLLIFVTLAGCGFGWLGIKVREARQQQADVAAIAKVGYVQYDYQFDSQGNEMPDAKPPGPAWLHELLGDDFFCRVYRVVINLPYASDADRDHVDGLTMLTDADLEHLAGFTRLKQLFLDGTHVTDAELNHLEGLTQLEVLRLSDTQVTDAGLEHLKVLPQLEWLRLDGTQVTDAGLENIQGMIELRGLWLVGTNVTDAGLEHLKRLTQLDWLYLGRTHVTASGVAKLKTALPNCLISR